MSKFDDEDIGYILKELEKLQNLISVLRTQIAELDARTSSLIRLGPNR